MACGLPYNSYGTIKSSAGSIFYGQNELQILTNIICRVPYSIMRSDSSDIRLFFFWINASNWFIHCFFSSDSVPKEYDQGVCQKLNRTRQLQEEPLHHFVAPVLYTWRSPNTIPIQGSFQILTCLFSQRLFHLYALFLKLLKSHFNLF